MRALLVWLLLSQLTGCVAQRYIGVQISSTAPMSVTRVWVNGDAVLLCRARE